jgi:hypothetical protein
MYRRMLCQTWRLSPVPASSKPHKTTHYALRYSINPPPNLAALSQAQDK